MKIVQMSPSLLFGDAVGNEMIAINDALVNEGYDTGIYALNIDKRINGEYIHTIDDYRDDESNLIIFHYAIGSDVNKKLFEYKSKIIIVYHNITPPEFFEEYDRSSAKMCERGLREIKELANVPVACIAVSEFNKSNLIEYGFKCPIDVVPILIKFDDYEKKPNEEVIKRYSNDGYVNILFTGRIAPNKKHENVIRAFEYYHNNINKKSRLFLVGSYDKRGKYYKKLKEYVRKLDIGEVYFSGHIGFDEILAYYSIADVFLCLSEHEGFCVPLVEAMCFDVPIVAYNTTAIGDTLGGAGMLFDTNSPDVIGEAINLVVTNEAIREKMISNGRERLKDFDRSLVAGQFIDCVKKYI